MKTVTDTIYVCRFEELSEGNKEKLRTWNVDDGWDDFILDDAKEALGKLGYSSVRFFYSGFGSQGDGASFEAAVSLTEWIYGHKKGNQYRSLLYWLKQEKVSDTVRIKQNGRYYHYQTMSIDDRGLRDCPTRKCEKQYQYLIDTILTEARETAKKVYRLLEDEYEYQTSDKTLSEYFEETDSWFTIDGRLRPPRLPAT